MADLAKKYTKQLNTNKDKSLVLARMVAETCRIALPIHQIRRLVKMYGEYTVYNAILITSEWVARSRIKDQDHIFKYLAAVSRNLIAEENGVTRQQQSFYKLTGTTKVTTEKIREIHDRKSTT